jgi:hypothetical protein
MDSHRWNWLPFLPSFVPLSAQAPIGHCFASFGFGFDFCFSCSASACPSSSLDRLADFCRPAFRHRPHPRCIQIFRHIHPTRRVDVIAHNRCNRFARSDRRTSSPPRRPRWASPSSSCLLVRKESQRPETTLAQFKYATSPGRSCCLGPLECGFCVSPPQSSWSGCPMPVQESRVIPRPHRILTDH